MTKVHLSYDGCPSEVNCKALSAVCSTGNRSFMMSSWYFSICSFTSVSSYSVAQLWYSLLSPMCMLVRYGISWTSPSPPRKISQGLQICLMVSSSSAIYDQSLLMHVSFVPWSLLFNGRLWCWCIGTLWLGLHPVLMLGMFRRYCVVLTGVSGTSQYHSHSLFMDSLSLSLWLIDRVSKPRPYSSFGHN